MGAETIAEETAALMRNSDDCLAVWADEASVALPKWPPHMYSLEDHAMCDVIVRCVPPVEEIDFLALNREFS